MTTRRTFLQASSASLIAAGLPNLLLAQTRVTGSAAWPSHPIRGIVPFSAGSTIDLIGRIVAEPLGAALGQNIIIENRGGAGGTIGTAIVVQAPPDGYTLLINASAHSAAPAAYPQAPYDTRRDVAGVAVFGVVPNVTVVSPSKGVKTLKDFVALAKKGKMTFASAGIGSATHWAAERLRLSAGFDATHVPFKGGAEALIEVVTGRVDFMCTGVSSGIGLIKEGRLVPLAVSTTRRSSALPDVPTTIEAGFPNSDYTYWNGLLVSAKTPRAIVDRLHAETMKALQQASVIEKFKPQGVEPMPLSPKDFDALIAKEIEINKAIVKAAGLKFS